MELPTGEPFTVLVGPADAGHTAALAARYAQALAGGMARLVAAPRCRWIAPTRTIAAAVRELLVDQAGVVLDPGVATFADLAEEVLRAAGRRAAVITPLQRRRLLGRLVERAAAAGRLQHFTPLAGTRGLAAVVDEAIAQLERRGLTPADCGRQAEAQGERRAADLALLFEQYRERLAAARLVDRPTLLAAAATALAEAPNLAGELELLVVDGFNDFTTIEFDLLRQLLPRAREAWIALPGEPRDAPAPRTELFAGPMTSAERLERELGGVVRHTPPPSRDAWPALARIERHLFRNYRDVEAPPPDTTSSLGRIHIVAASGEQAEIVEIARRVKRHLVEGVAPADIVVVFRATRDVAERVRQTFEDYGIPSTIDSGRRLAATALVRTLRCVLELAAADWPYRRVLQAAGDRTIRLFNVADDGTDSRRAIELCVRYAQLPQGRRELFAQLETWAGDAARTSEPKHADAALARRTLAELADALDALPRRGSLDRWITALGQAADRIGLLRPAIGDTPANWGILVQSLRGAGRIDAAIEWDETELTLAEFIDLVDTVARQATAAARDDNVGRVRVLSAEAARAVPCQHLFLAGLSEQAFPIASASSAVSLAADQVAAHRSSEMLLFYQLVTRPTATLTLSYPALDERAQSLPPSPFLVELERVFSPLRVERTDQPLNYAHVADADDEPPLSRAELRRQAVARALGSQRELLATLSAGPTPAPAAGPAIVAGIEAIARRGRRDEFGPFDGVLASPEVMARLRREYGPNALWSPSRLERYAECPFRFFGEHLLNLRATPELVLASDIARRGSVLHATLAQLYAGLGSLAAEIPPEQLAAGLVDQFHATLAAVAEARPGRGVDAAIREIERRQIAAWAERFAQQHVDYQNHWRDIDGPLRAAYFEVRFGPGSRNSDSRGDAALSTDEPFTLEARVDDQTEQVRFTGQVDRLDVGRVGDRVIFNVIDYKTGARNVVKLDEIHAGRQIQLPLYALAAEQLLLADQNAAPLSAGYWSVAGQGFRAAARSGGPLAMNEIRDGALVPTAAWDATRARLIARIGEIIAAIRRGEFPVFNDNPQCTSYCDLRTICRIAQVRSLEKQWPPEKKGEMERG